MVRFNDLRIDKHTKHLIIDVSVLNYNYFKDVTLKKIYVQTQDQYSDQRVTEDNSVYVYDVVDEEKHHTLKSIQLELSSLDLLDGTKSVDTEKNMFFVWVECTGTPNPKTPCGMDKNFVIGVTFDMCDIYKEFMNNIKEMNKCCDIPKQFIDSFLRLEAIKIAVDAGHFMQAATYYKKFVMKKIKLQSANVCGCHG